MADSGSDDEDFSAFKTPGGKDAAFASMEKERDAEAGLHGIVLCGYLYKSGSTIAGRWNRRWVTLTKRRLLLFAERTDEKPKTALKLREVKEISPSKKMVM